MRKIITFLGTVARETVYRYRDENYTGRVFGEAMRQFLDFDQMLVFVTAAARRKAYPVLAELGDPRIQPVDIPLAETPEDLWQLFDSLTDQVEIGDRVIFDITHALRSIPFLVFLAAAYLRSAKDVTIEKVLYGALELGRDRPAAPVVELTELITLLDWLMATNQFIYTGDARYLASLLEQEGQSRRSNALKGAGTKLRDLSLSMMLCRPLEAMEKAGILEIALARAKKDMAQWTPPFGLLAGRIQREYAARTLQDPTSDEHAAASLNQQLNLIHWYLENNQVIQAMTLAREWVVSAVGWRLGRGFVLKRKEREHDAHNHDRGIARGLNGLCRIKRSDLDFTRADLNPEGQTMLGWPEWDSLARLWNDLTAIRNELNHAGMNPSAMKAEKIARKAKDEIWPRLETMAQKWQLLHQETRR